MATVGFIGLGNMGGPMARNLLAAGHRLIVYDVSTEVGAPLQVAGAATPDEVAGAARRGR